MRHTSGTESEASSRRPRVAALAAVLALALVAVAGCTRDTAGVGRSFRSAERPVELNDVRLVSASSCDDLIAAAEAREQAHQEQIESWQGSNRVYDGDMATTVAPMPSAAADAEGGSEQAGEPGGTVIAGTNNQEQGVDEGDLAKTDGQVLVTLSSDGVLRVVALDDSPQVDAVLALDEQGSTYGGGDYGRSGQLMLRSTSGAGREVVAVHASSTDDGTPVVDIARIDLTDPAGPILVERARVAGELVATRMIGGVGRVVIRPALGGPIVDRVPVPTTAVPNPTTTETTEPVTTVPDRSTSTTTTVDPTERTEANDIPSAAAALLPQRLTDGGVSVPLGDCDDVLSVPPTAQTDPSGRGGAGDMNFDGAAVDMAYPATSGATVLTVGDTLGDLAPVTIEGGAETVYAGTDALYTTSTSWIPTSTGGDSLTAVHRFDLSVEGPARYTGSGLVPGSMLNQYSMSDRDGALRVVTTAQTPVQGSGDVAEEPAGPDEGVAAVVPSSTTAGRITVLRPGDDGTLKEVGHLDDLGLGEEVKSVRFIEDRAYVVTFRQTDPLFAVDMSTDAPKLLGQLKIPGFSEYLHPVGDGRLLGIGSDADPQTGRVTGFKASLFDATDPANPVELDSFTEAGASSSVGQDPHAFTWDPVRSQAIVPVTVQPSIGSTRPTVDLPPPTTVVCPPDAACTSPAVPEVGSDPSGVGAEERYPQPVDAAWVIGIDGDRLVRRGTLVHELGNGTDQILRSLVVDSSIWTVSDRAVGRSNAAAPTAPLLIRF